MFLTAALLLSAGVCSAQTSTPKQKAKQFVEQVFDCINQQNFDKLEKIGTEMGQYFNFLDDEEKAKEFATKFYEYSEKYGYGKEFADQFLATFSQTLLEGVEEKE